MTATYQPRYPVYYAPPAESRLKLAALFRPVLGEPVPVREISLYSQADRGQPFRLVERFPLAAAASDSPSAG